MNQLFFEKNICGSANRNIPYRPSHLPSAKYFAAFNFITAVKQVNKQASKQKLKTAEILYCVGAEAYCPKTLSRAFQLDYKNSDKSLDEEI